MCWSKGKAYNLEQFNDGIREPRVLFKTILLFTQFIINIVNISWKVPKNLTLIRIYLSKLLLLKSRNF